MVDFAVASLLVANIKFGKRSNWLGVDYYHFYVLYSHPTGQCNERVVYRFMLKLGHGMHKP